MSPAFSITLLLSILSSAVALDNNGVATLSPKMNTGAAAAATFSLAWTKPLPYPYEPMAMGVVAHADTVVLGLRDCPDNTENELMYLSLSTGDVVNKVAQTNGTSEISIAHRAKEVIVYGIGWVKTAVPQKTYIAAAVGTTPDTFHQWASVYNGEGSMWGSSSVSSTGDLGALLLEPTPDEKHMNNRSAVLMLFGPSSSTPLYTYQIDGLGTTDPQTVSISAHSNGADDTYTVAAVMGFVTVVVDYSMQSGKATIVYRKSASDDGQDAMVVAVSPDGKQFAVSTDANVNVFHRNADGMFAKVGFSSVKPPVTDQTANAIIFAEEPAKAEATGADSTNTLAVAWVGQQGESTGTSVHSVTSEGKVEAVWKHHQECGGSNFDSINNNGLAMTANGGYVVVGKWGCGIGKLRPKNVAVFQGVGGSGVPVFEAGTRGEVWAVDIDVAANGTVSVGAAAWAENTNTKANSKTKRARESDGNTVVGSAVTPSEIYIWTTA